LGDFFITALVAPPANDGVATPTTPAMASANAHIFNVEWRIVFSLDFFLQVWREIQTGTRQGQSTVRPRTFRCNKKSIEFSWLPNISVGRFFVR
jgi:hypothetical protein